MSTEIIGDENVKSRKQKDIEAKRPAWIDEDDKLKKYKITVPTKKSKYGGDESSDDSDDELTLQAIDIIKKSSSNNELQYKHVSPVNYQHSSKSSTNQIEFHPKHPMSMVCLNRGVIELFEIDGEKNTYLQQIKIEDTRRYFARFCPSGASIIISCQRHVGRVYVYDIGSEEIHKNVITIGRNAQVIEDFTVSPDSNLIACRNNSPDVLLVSSKTFENLHTIRLNHNAIASQFLDPTRLLTLSQPGTAYVWDLRNHSKCMHKFNDQDCIKSTSMALSVESQLLALGSNTGVVNLFGLGDCLTLARPNPIRIIQNLKETIKTLKFGHGGEMLLLASNTSANQIRIYDTTRSVIYRNFPKVGKNYQIVNDADFSPNAKFLSLATSKGHAPLIRLLQYSDY